MSWFKKSSTMATPPDELLSKQEPQNQESLQSFVAQKPLAMYTIDGQKGSNESLICRSNETGGQSCIKLGFNCVELFKKMQKFDYFCSLPDNVNATYFECRKIQ
ncbi:Hypothetical protein PP7435_CHR2-0146 [Komagataella phaffii CBS 7435]|uniref:Uncharacterized protein n=2 Tax=Komagataella phaffii TaxID=460519 RepID=C4R2R2_KOMPG|nr:Hypothetical protein PAS_chr2-2_0139 [Komagataella phaffii GS115]AOA62550.1 GQ67_01206T0 [Komagataella phaffii]KAI0462230.1 hypothetical protein LJB42_004318 [Komagataella kurtzmanii]CAH2447658.1 Hypothetical protein BQ9382_C2-0780 [Komagataella phaffii CBS 7435]AOA68163.1 GQ68_00183T0 [Komagataella phaffii GS115]CAY69786.1 Hypothetical protein PAS_chr2-2_0139 [Komagataella phaffii GS115]